MRTATEHGAEIMLNCRKEDVVARIMEATKGVGVAAVFDSIGAATFDQDLQALARDGTLVSYGNTSGNVPSFEITKLSPKNLKVMKPSVFGYISTHDNFIGYARDLFQFIKKNGANKTSREIYPLSEVAKAHADLEERRTSGKLLLKT
jgi:NADPH2:quinone reductase